MSYNPNNPNGKATSANSAPVVLASDEIVPVSLPSYALDAFNQVVIGERVNDAQCAFTGSGTLSTLVTTAFTGTGAGIWAGGQVVWSTGATNPSTVYAASIGTVTYTPGAEIYAYFTAYFTQGGAASTYQRIGLTDKTNGVYVSMEAAVFNISLITGGSITAVPQSSFNVDALVGSSTSKFTRAGAPEAINLAYQNVFRIRMGWVGSAPIIYEVLSPDDQWVIFHILRIPNSQNTPSIQNPNLPISVWMNGLGANLTLGTSCWATGTSSPFVQKGVSSGGYMPTQDAKDSSRTYITFYIDAITGVTTEALVTMNINTGGTVTTGTSFTVPVGKVLRLQSISATVKTTNTTASYGRVRVRSAAAVAASSGVVMNVDIPATSGTVVIGDGQSQTYTLTDCMEISAGQQIGVSQLASSVNTTVSCFVTGYLY